MESSNTWLYDCLQIFSPLYDADICPDVIPKYYQQTVIGFDIITIQLLNFATALSVLTLQKMFYYWIAMKMNKIY